MSNQANHSSSNISEENNSQWPSSRFCCPHCPFIGCNKYSLGSHIRYHFSRLSLQCSFCTFSVSSKNAMMRHMNRVHPEEALKYAVKKKLAKKWQQSSVNTAIIPTQSTQVLTEDISNENEIHVIEDQEFEEEEVMVIEHDPDNPCCLSCGKEQGSDQCNKMVQCDECESWFHASCVNLKDDGQLDTTKHWFCPLCIHKETPLSHMTKLTQAIDCFAKVYQGVDGHIGDRSELLGINQSNTTLPMNPNLDEEKEEIQCRKELDQLTENIRSCRTNLAQAFKEMEAEARHVLLSRTNKAKNLRQRMETLKITEKGLSIELAVLMEQKRRIHLDETEKTKLKMRTDRELFDLKFSSCRKMKEEASLRSSSSLENENDRKIKSKEKLLAKLKKKLDEIGKEERDLNERIQTTEGRLEENTKNLAELRKDLESLRALPASSSSSSSSSIAVGIAALKSEVCERVNRFAYLEEHLILLNSSRIIDDIRQKKKEWLDSYDCGDEN